MATRQKIKVVVIWLVFNKLIIDAVPNFSLFDISVVVKYRHNKHGHSYTSVIGHIDLFPHT